MIVRRPPTPVEKMNATMGLLTVLGATLAWMLGSPLGAGLVLIVGCGIRFLDKDDDDFDEDCHP